MKPSVGETAFSRKRKTLVGWEMRRSDEALKAPRQTTFSHKRKTLAGWEMRRSDEALKAPRQTTFSHKRKCARLPPSGDCGIRNAPGWGRTSNLYLRRVALYPVELRARDAFYRAPCAVGGFLGRDSAVLVHKHKCGRALP